MRPKKTRGISGPQRINTSKSHTQARVMWREGHDKNLVASVTEHLNPASGQAQLDPSVNGRCRVCQELPHPSESEFFQGGKKRLQSQASVSHIFRVLGGMTSCPC